MTTEASLLVGKANDILSILEILSMSVEGSKLSLYSHAQLADQLLIVHSFSAPCARDSVNCAHAHYSRI